MSQMLALLQLKFVQDALLAALVVGVICSYLGVFVVLKRIVFVGAALSEMASLGAALAFTAPAAWIFETIIHAVPALHPLDHFRPLVFALAMMLISVVFFSQNVLGRKVPREAVIGTAFAGAIGLTLLVLSTVQNQGQHELGMLRGNIMGVPQQEIVELIVTAVIVAVIQGLFFKEFVLVSFDPEVARTLGFRSSRWELLWYLTLGVMIAVSIHVAGTVLVFAFLVMPAVSALLLSRRLGVVLLLSVLFGVTATVAGVLISVSPLDLPTSYAIVGVLVLIFTVSWLLKTVTAPLRKG
ncbi:MAG: metal ABC transporter permease [Actinomycetota bacterium]